MDNLNENRIKLSDEAIKKIVNLATKNLNRLGTLHIDNIPVKKLTNVNKIYENTNEKVNFLYDTTLFGSGKDGLVLFDSYIGYKVIFLNCNKFYFTDLVVGGLSKEQNAIFLNGAKIDIEKEEYLFFKDTKKFLIETDIRFEKIYINYIDELTKNIEKDFEQKEYKVASKKLKHLKMVTKDKNYDKKIIYYEFIINNELLFFEKALQMLNQIKDSNFFDFEEISNLESAFLEHVEKSIEISIKNKEFNKAKENLEIIGSSYPNLKYKIWNFEIQIGQFNFNKIQEIIGEISSENQEVIPELLEKLDSKKQELYDLIRNAVFQKNYDFFINDSSKRFIKDDLGMTPIMYFIAMKDLKGVKMLKDTYNVNDLNIIGHNARNLLGIDFNIEFAIKFLAIFDEDLIKLRNELKQQKIINGGKNFFDTLIKVSDREYTKNFGDIQSKEEKKEQYMKNQNRECCKNQRDMELAEFEKDIEKFEIDMIFEERKKYLNILFDNRSDSGEIKKLQLLKEDLERQLINFKNTINNPEKIIDELVHKFLDFSFEKKDEFESTTDYNLKKCNKFIEIKENYMEYEFVREKFEERNKLLNKKLEKIQGEFLEIERKINSIQLGKEVNGSIKLLEWYYKRYFFESKFELKNYDADSEVFDLQINNKKASIKVPLKIAKNFKTEFEKLNPKIFTEIKIQNESKKIIHTIQYSFRGEVLICEIFSPLDNDYL